MTKRLLADRGPAPGAAPVALAVLLATVLLPAHARGQTTPAHHGSVDSLAAPSVAQVPTLVVKVLPVPPPALPILVHPPGARDKVHPRLRKAIEDNPGLTDTVIVTWRDPFRADPRVFGAAGRPPDPRDIEARLTRLREPVYRSLGTRLGTLGARIMQTFWIAQSAVIRVPRRAIFELARDDSVFRINPLAGEEPPQDHPPIDVDCALKNDATHVAKVLMGTERYRLKGPSQSADRVALLDTGVNSRHRLLKGSLGRLVDCTIPGERPGSVTCRESSSQSDEQSTGHGTAAAALLAGNESLGTEYSGVTQARVESYRVYRGSTALEAAILAAAQDAVIAHDDPIVIQSQNVFGPSQAAEVAYRAGAVVIATNGNHHNSHPAEDGIPSPASSPFAIGVGMYCIQKYLPSDDHAWGKTLDGRIKPEIGGPTGARTASGPSESALQQFGHTSGSTPLVGGAALLLRNWLELGGDVVDPGQVYALLILCGQRTKIDCREGAGPIHLPQDGEVFWSALDVAAGDSVMLDLNTQLYQPKVSQLDAAIWWLESDASFGGFPDPERRAWITLDIGDPDGRHSEPSDVPYSVFQRTSLARDSEAKAGVWQLKITGRWIPDGVSRHVYYAAWMRP